MYKIVVSLMALVAIIGSSLVACRDRDDDGPQETALIGVDLEAAEAGRETGAVKLIISDAPDADATVNFALTGSRATRNVDYGLAITNSRTDETIPLDDNQSFFEISAGVNEITITVTPIDDTVDDNDETVKIAIPMIRFDDDDPSTDISSVSGSPQTVTIEDDEPDLTDTQQRNANCAAALGDVGYRSRSGSAPPIEAPLQNRAESHTGDGATSETAHSVRCHGASEGYHYRLEAIIVYVVREVVATTNEWYSNEGSIRVPKSTVTHDKIRNFFAPYAENPASLVPGLACLGIDATDPTITIYDIRVGDDFIPRYPGPCRREYRDHFCKKGLITSLFSGNEIRYDTIWLLGKNGVAIDPPQQYNVDSAMRLEYSHAFRLLILSEQHPTFNESDVVECGRPGNGIVINDQITTRNQMLHGFGHSLGRSHTNFSQLSCIEGGDFTHQVINVMQQDGTGNGLSGDGDSNTLATPGCVRHDLLGCTNPDINVGFGAYRFESCQIERAHGTIAGRYTLPEGRTSNNPIYNTFSRVEEPIDESLWAAYATRGYQTSNPDLFESLSNSGTGSFR